MVEHGDHAVGKMLLGGRKGLSSATGRRCFATIGASIWSGHMKGFSSDSNRYCNRSGCSSRRVWASGSVTIIRTHGPIKAS